MYAYICIFRSTQFPTALWPREADIYVDRLNIVLSFKKYIEDNTYVSWIIWIWLNNRKVYVFFWNGDAKIPKAYKNDHVKNL